MHNRRPSCNLMLCNLMLDIITSITRKRQTQKLKMIMSPIGRPITVINTCEGEKKHKSLDSLSVKKFKSNNLCRNPLYMFPVFPIPVVVILNVSPRLEKNNINRKGKKHGHTFFLSSRSRICKLPPGELLMESARRISGRPGSNPF